MVTINVVDFSRQSGISESDIFVLDKQYKSNDLRTPNDWYDLLFKDFKIPFDIRINVVKEESFDSTSKAEEIVKEIKEKKNNK